MSTPTAHQDDPSTSQHQQQLQPEEQPYLDMLTRNDILPSPPLSPRMAGATRCIPQVKVTPSKDSNGEEPFIIYIYIFIYRKSSHIWTCSRAMIYCSLTPQWRRPRKAMVSYRLSFIYLYIYNLFTGKATLFENDILPSPPLSPRMAGATRCIPQVKVTPSKDSNDELIS